MYTVRQETIISKFTNTSYPYQTGNFIPIRMLFKVIFKQLFI